VNVEFWCVWEPTHGSPTVKQRSLGEAEKEASRLAAAHPGRRFYVLHAVACCETAPVPVVHLRRLDEVPF